MDYLARRNHSELELRRKLLKRFEPEEVDLALEECRQNNWLAEPSSIAEQTAAALNRRKKGFLHIQRYLRQKGLPGTTRDLHIEITKAQELIERKYPKLLDFESRQKAHRFLKSRGFQDEVIRKVLYGNDRT